MSYKSRKLNEHEHKCVTRDLELEGIIHALKMWKNYLLGRIIILMSGHSGLRYLFIQPNINSRQARWLDNFSEFEFEIRYIKREVNQVVDDLRRKVQMNHIAAMSSYGTNLQDKILQVGQ